VTGGGLSATRLATLHEVLAGHVASGAVPGLVAAVARRGEVHVEVIGDRAYGGPPMTRDTLFRVSSMTKPVVAAAAMVLVEDGLLGLDDPVDPWLPELAAPRVLRSVDGPLDDTVPAQRAVTLRDLLTFTMGTGQLIGVPATTPLVAALAERGLAPGPPAPDRMPEPDEYLRRLGSVPLAYQPGQRWLYNTSAETLGVLLARAGGQPLEDALRDRLLVPAGMTDTAFWVRAPSLDRFGPCYLEGAPSPVVHDDAAGQWSHPPAFPSGGAGLVSTADDFLAFGRLLLGGGTRDGVRVLSPASVGLMTTDHLTAGQRATVAPVLADGTGWGFGTAVVTRRTQPYETVGRFGWNGGLGSSWWCDPHEDLVGVLLTPSAWPSPVPPPVVQDFWTGAYAAIDD
jgi:CubicO group peptidase (beta-lactamase class C family)